MLPLPKTKAQPKRGVRIHTPPQDSVLPDFDPSLVCPEGDLVLSVRRHHSPSASDDEVSSHVYLYRVDSNQLRTSSPYFARLLDPDKFAEGADIAKQHAELRITYPNPAAVPFDCLPRVNIADLGRIAPAVKSIQNLMSDFLRILHDQPLSVKLPPLSNVANLVVVADRFDALHSMRSYFRARKLIAALDSLKTTASKNPTKLDSEERVRQKLLVGLLLDNPSWVLSSSLRIIQKGWVGHESPSTTALWWDLPHGIEDELLFRREMILDTIQSLQSYFLDLYTSRTRQCKLGYDSSPECDLYQLGQAVKFFRKIDTLVLAGNIIGPPDEAAAQRDEEVYYDGDVFDLLDSLRKIPSYQIDKNHHHCGLRTRLLPLLDLLSFSLSQEVGICLHCWNDSREEYAWKSAKRPLVWRQGSAGGAMATRYREGQAQRHLYRHLDACELWLAVERVWTQEDAEGNKGVGWSHPNLPYRS